MECVVFFQAEDGIRAAHYGLEFRRVLFRSSNGDALSVTGGDSRHQPMVYLRTCRAGCTGDVATCNDFFHRSVGGLNFFGDDHQDFEDVFIWEAMLGNAWYRVGADYNVAGHVWTNFFPFVHRMLELLVGRPSCWECVCQYVCISGFSASCK